MRWGQACVLWCSPVPSCMLSQICAVLAAVTEVIRSQGGTESETEYFAALVSGCCVWGRSQLEVGSSLCWGALEGTVTFPLHWAVLG